MLPIGVAQELLLAGKHGEEWIGLFKRYVAAAEKAGDPVRMPIIGSTRFYGYDSEKSEIEIGWTFLARSYWGGHYYELKRKTPFR